VHNCCCGDIIGFRLSGSGILSKEKTNCEKKKIKARLDVIEKLCDKRHTSDTATHNFKVIGKLFERKKRKRESLMLNKTTEEHWNQSHRLTVE
jgi:RNase H-fold protein (predicted Holliday junction resolvase)